MSTDIQNQGWISKCPPHWQPYLILARVDRPIGIWLLLLPALWAIALAVTQFGRPTAGFIFWSLWITALFTLGAIFMRSAGCIINDLWDRDLDAGVERTRQRPLASGEIPIGRAVIFLGALLLGGFCVLILLNPATILLGLLTIPLIIIYPLMKRVTFWPQAVLGLTFNFGALMGWTAITGALSPPALFLYSAGFFWTMGYDTIYAHMDKEDDILIGVKSTALKFGAQSKYWVVGFYTATGIFLTLALISATKTPLSGLFLLPTALYFFKLLRQWDMNDTQSALHIFRANRNAGLLILAGLFLGGLAGNFLS
ncbi:MAG: 4-hydroxybenzoate octaprenyltransferase [Alphaproteobacteria bacterium]|nr:4-hydroxybenzoate octaprenyltransferase [Alphaproteobacteria bacterium]